MHREWVNAKRECPMKDCASRVVRRAAMAAVIVFGLGVASASDRTWTGDAGDGKWSTPGNWSGQTVPASGDTVILDGTATSPNSVVDADFAGTVQRVKLQSTYLGTLTLERSLRVTHQYMQYAGTVVCGANDLWVGTAGTAANCSTFEVFGGTFHAPSTTLRWTTKTNGSVSFRLNNEAAWDANGGTVFLDLYSAYNIYLYASNRVFSSLMVGGTTTGGIDWSKCYNNRITGMLTHVGGAINGGGESAFFVEGSVNVSSNANGGTGWLTFNGDTDQTIAFGEPYDDGNLAYGSTCGIKLDKSRGGKLTVTGKSAHFGTRAATLKGTEKLWSGFKVLGGTLDFSGLDRVSVWTSYTTIHVDPEAQVLMPEDFVIRASSRGGNSYDWGTILEANGLEFNNLTLRMMRALQLQNETTNVVLGCLTIEGAGLRVYKPKDTYSTKWWESGVAHNGTILLYGNITNRNLYAENLDVCGGNGVIRMVGSADSVIYSDGGYLPTLVVEKDEGVKVTCEPSDQKMVMRTKDESNGFVLQSGVFTLPDAGCALSNCYHSAFYQLGGTLNAGLGDMYFGGYTAYVKCIDPAGGITVDLPGTTGGLMINSKSELIVTGPFVCNRGRIGYRSYGDTSRLVLQGDYIISDRWFGGNMPIDIIGDKDQHYSCSQYGTNVAEAVNVKKTGGRFVLDTDMDLTKRLNGGAQVATTLSQAVNLTAGTLDLNGHVLKLPPTGTTTVGEGFHFAFPAAEPEARACVVAADKLQFPTTAGSVELELTGKVRSVSPNPIPAFGYGSLVKPFDPSVFTLVPHQSLTKRFAMTDDTTDKIVFLKYMYKRGLMMSLR